MVKYEVQKEIDGVWYHWATFDDVTEAGEVCFSLGQLGGDTITNARILAIEVDEDESID